MGNSGESDPYWSSVSALLHMDGVNGGTTFIEQKGKTTTPIGSVNTSSTQVKFGSASLASGLAGFTASRATTVLTVTAITYGTITVGMQITDQSTNGIVGIITSLGTGTGGTGTYNMNTSGTIASHVMIGAGYVGVADSADFQFGTGDFTIEGWFYIVGTVSQTQSIASYGKSTFTTANDVGWRILLVGSKIYGSFFNGTTDQGIQGTTTLSQNTWYYFKYYKVSGVTYLNLNGTQEATATKNVSVNAPGTSWGLRIGSSTADNSSFPLQGYVDDIRITKGVGRTGTTVPTSAFPNS